MNEKYAVVNGWLVENVDHHTCGAGTAETGYAHEPGCGQEPLARIEELLQSNSRITRLRKRLDRGMTDHDVMRLFGELRTILDGDA